MDLKGLTFEKNEKGKSRKKRGEKGREKKTEKRRKKEKKRKLSNSQSKNSGYGLDELRLRFPLLPSLSPFPFFFRPFPLSFFFPSSPYPPFLSASTLTLLANNMFSNRVTQSGSLAVDALFHFVDV